MVTPLHLYARLVAASARAQMQYRVNFLLASLGVFIATGVELVGLWALFERFGGVRGWRFPEVAFLYGVVSVTFALADAFALGFDTFATQIRSGDFDRVLLRPRTTLLQMLGQGVAMRRVGRLVQGLLVLGWAVSVLEVDWSAGRVALLLFAIAGGFCLFLGLFVLQATAAFWTVETLEVFNAFTYGGTVAAQYPLTIYDPWFRQFFTFIVPLACVTYFPLTLVLGRSDALGVPGPLRAAAPLVGIAFLALAFWAWGFGVRRYASTGS